MDRIEKLFFHPSVPISTMKRALLPHEKQPGMWGFLLKCKDANALKHADIKITGGYSNEERRAIESQLRESGDKLLAKVRPHGSDPSSSSDCPNVVWIYRTPEKYRAFVCSFSVSNSKSNAGNLEIFAQEIPPKERWSMVDTELSPYNALTAREKIVCALLMQGKTNKEIGAQLFISPHTVDNHRVSIFKKLGVHSVRDLIHLSYSIGWPQ